MRDLKEISRHIIEKDDFLICGHIDPDGDCIGSAFGLKWALSNIGKNCCVILTQSIEDDYDFLAINSDDYILVENLNKNNCNNLNWSKTNFIVLDSSNIERLGEVAKSAKNSFLINIDHHQDNTFFGDVNFVDSSKAAVGVIIYQLLSLMEISIDEQIGRALATAIIADTGAFRYENTTPEVLRIIADLMDTGVDLYRINSGLFSNNSYKLTKLKGMAISTLKNSKDGKIAWLYIEQDMFQKAGIVEYKSHDLVNQARDIKGVEVGISFTEKDDGIIKVSFRSNRYCPVNKIAAQFGGGGHPRAAGCEIEDNLDNVISIVIEEVKKHV
ncbi:MAG: DHH family phosphoesterase [Halanaerobiales bacterium]